VAGRAESTLGRVLKARRGPKKAVIAVAASILTAVYHMLKDGTFYQDLGADHLVKHEAAATVWNATGGPCAAFSAP
jgi:hypothetical protein